VLESAGRAASQAGVEIVTGDTKVVERGGVAGMVLNTAGVGELLEGAGLGFERIAAGDEIVLSGALGEHALAVMSQRESLSFTADLESDCASLHELTASLLEALGEDVHFMRDPTRGGLAATLVDIAEAAGKDVEVAESAIPVNRTARAAAEMLGLDLLGAANEGKLVAVVAGDRGARAVEVLSQFTIAARSGVVGRIGEQSDSPLVELITTVGGRRIVQMPYGEELPRIC
jgi:hydrogenase expression/formation protein HypE